MNPLAQALQAIQQSLTGQGGQTRPPLPGTYDPEAQLQYGSPTTGQDASIGGLASGVPAGLFNDNPAPQQQDTMSAGEKFLQDLYSKGQKDLLSQKAKIDQALSDYNSKSEKFMQLHHPDLVKPKEMTDSQRYIPFLIAALANLDPSVRRSNAANQAAGAYWGGVNQSNEQDAQLKNTNLQQAFQDEYNRQALGLKNSGSQLDRLNQDYTKSSDSLDTTAARLAGTLDTNETRRLDTSARIAGKQKLQELIGSQKDGPTAVRMATEANDAAIKNGQPPIFSAAEVAQFGLSKQIKELGQANQANSNADLMHQKALTWVDQAYADIGVKNATAADKEKHAAYLQAKVDYLPFEEDLKKQGIDLRRDAVAQGWAKVSIARDKLDESVRQGDVKAQQSALTTSARSASALLKELGLRQRNITGVLTDPVKSETLKNLPSGTGQGSAYDDYVKAQKSIGSQIEEAKQDVLRYSMPVTAPKAVARKGRPNPLPGYVPVDPMGPGYLPVKIKALSDQLANL